MRHTRIATLAGDSDRQLARSLPVQLIATDLILSQALSPTMVLLTTMKPIERTQAMQERIALEVLTAISESGFSLDELVFKTR